MTLRIEIQEQPERARYWAEVEVGGMIARRREVMVPKADGLSGVLAAVYAAAAEMDPRIMPPEPKPEAPSSGGHWVPGNNMGDPDQWMGCTVATTSPALSFDSLDALRGEAEAAGVRVDRRWGEARLRQEIASAGHAKARDAECPTSTS